jgi:tryptophanyl-tRNA synthetase
MSRFPRIDLAAGRRFLSTGSSAPSKVVFSGIQPTGVPHLGNYLGALRQWADIQASAAPSAKLIFSIVDLHAITQPQEAGELRRCRKEMLAAILAVGIDPARSIVFEQSRVPQHAELMWILSCGASTGYLSRMTQWKVGAASRRQQDTANVCEFWR